MTNTIANVPRELKPCPFCGGEPNLTTADYVHDDLTPMPVVECRSCSAWVQADDWNTRAPSPAGVDGLKRYEVFPYLDDDVAELDICEADDGSFVKYDAAAAIIDGLRGGNEALHAQVKVLQSDANSWQSGYDEGRRMGGKHCALTIDQQAQRIGELEGLLRESYEDGEYFMEEGLLERIDAALSAEKEDSQ